ncbi:MAG: tyrosine-type recombinase/integrase [Dehalococcoidia bacterium]
MVQNGTWEWLLEGFKLELEVNVKPVTIDYYYGRLKVFIDWAKNSGQATSPDSVTKRDIQAFLHWLVTAELSISCGNGAGRVSRERSRWPYYRALKRFFGWAVSEGYLERNPMDGVVLKQPPTPAVEPYQPEHLNRMLKVLDEDWRNAMTPRQKMLAARDRAILYLFLESGLRLEELSNLCLANIDLNKQRIMILHGKMDKSRMVGFGLQTKKALWRYIGLRLPTGETDGLWLTEEGHPMTKQGVQQVIRRLKEDAGLKHLKGTVHKLRHTFATTYLRHTRDMKGCRLLLGHSTLAMTERYTQFVEVEDALKAYDGKGPLDWMQGG